MECFRSWPRNLVLVVLLACILAVLFQVVQLLAEVLPKVNDFLHAEAVAVRFRLVHALDVALLPALLRRSHLVLARKQGTNVGVVGALDGTRDLVFVLQHAARRFRQGRELEAGAHRRVANTKRTARSMAVSSS